MFGGLTIESVFLVVIGAVIFVVGTTALRKQIRIKMGKLLKEAKIINISHVTKKDDEGYLIQNYYDIKVEFEDKGKTLQKTLKCIDQYEKGDTVKIIKDIERGGQYRVYGNDKAPVFGPWILILCGILVICMPFVQLKFGDGYMSMLLAIFLMLIGLGLVLAYIKAKSRDLEEIPAEIADILKWQSGQKKKWTNPSISYYPIIKYKLNGKEKIMRSRYNSSSVASYKVGKQLVLYKDKNTGDILERGARKSMLIIGIFLILFAAIGLYSSLIMLYGA